MSHPAKPDTPPAAQAASDLAVEVLGRVADKWTLLVIEALVPGERRFTQVRDAVGAVSHKVLTQTLRRLERDGLITRTVHAVVPPRVEYRLTPLGHSLGAAACALWLWAETHALVVAAARATYDAERPVDPDAG